MEKRPRHGFQIGAIGWMLLSPVVALIVLVSCSFILWPDGAAGLHRLADQEAGYVSTAVGDRLQLPASLAEAAYQMVAAPINGAAGLSSSSMATGGAGDLGQAGQKLEQQLLAGTKPTLDTLALALWLVALRIGVLMLALPTFMLAAGVGLVDGMTLRFLRRAGGARESSFLYHRAKHIARAVIVGTCLLYLAVPYPLDPRVVLLPAAVAFAFSLRTATGYFKKYL